MRYVQYKENGMMKYEELSILHSVDGYISSLENRGCTEIKITSDKEISGMIRRYNSKHPIDDMIPENKMQRSTYLLDYRTGKKMIGS